MFPLVEFPELVQHYAPFFKGQMLPEGQVLDLPALLPGHAC